MPSLKRMIITKYADILNQIEASRQALTALSLPAGSKNLTEAIEAIIKAQLKKKIRHLLA